MQRVGGDIQQLHHVNPVDGLETGDTVEAGDHVGKGIYPTPENGTWDLIFGTVDLSNDLFLSDDAGISLDSYCAISEFLSDDAEAVLANYGVDDASELYFTLEQRNSDQCQGTMGGDNVSDNEMSFEGNDTTTHWIDF